MLIESIQSALRRLPLATWTRGYGWSMAGQDALAALLVTALLVPQALAYAFLAGLPPQVGLYASGLPLLVYALLGSSRVLAVGPMALTSLMTGAAVATAVGVDGASTTQAAVALAVLSGLMLMGMGLLRLGFLANFLSQPVMSGFVSASALLIAAGQLAPLMGIPGGGHTLQAVLQPLWAHAHALHGPTLLLGGASLLWLVWARRGLHGLWVQLGGADATGRLVGQTAPLWALVGTSAAVAAAQAWWHTTGLPAGANPLSDVAVVGVLPAGLPPLAWPAWQPGLWVHLAGQALLIAVVGVVGAISVGQTLAARRRERIDPNQEMWALGASNLASGLSGGLPVTGGLSRSVVNADAGAQTPVAGALTALALVLVVGGLTPLLRHLPQAVLAAAVMVPVLSLVDVAAMRRTWRFSRFDGAALLTTLLATLTWGVAQGLLAGLVVSLLLVLWRTSHPHMAVVGRVPGTEHYRNVQRHAVECLPQVLGLRVDESLYFGNARALEDRINLEVAQQPTLRHVVLLCSAVNDVDASALDSLDAINHRLRAAGIALHLSEVKGPVMDRLQRTGWLHQLSGRVFLTHHQAIQALSSDGG